MSDFIKIDNKELKDLSRDLKIKRKSQIKAVQRTVLNEEAKATRLMAIKSGGTIDDALTIRGGGKTPWTKSSVLTDFATSKKMQSEVGSKYKWRKNPSKKFYGLGDAEEGSNDTGDSVISPMARVSGLQNRNVGKKNRDLIGNPIAVNSSDPYQQIKEIAGVEESQPDKAFFVKRGRNGLRRGIYKFTKKKKTWKDGTKHMGIQILVDKSKSGLREKKRPWLRPAVKKAISNQSIAEMYREAFIKYTSKNK